MPFITPSASGDSLVEHPAPQGHLSIAIRQGMGDIFKVQGLTLLVLLLIGTAHPKCHRHPSPVPAALLRGSGWRRHPGADACRVQRALLSGPAGARLALSFLFTTSNLLLTPITQWLGPAFYGYGFALATAITSVSGLNIISRRLEGLECDTFMQQA